MILDTTKHIVLDVPHFSANSKKEELLFLSSNYFNYKQNNSILYETGHKKENCAFLTRFPIQKIQVILVFNNILSVPLALRNIFVTFWALHVPTLLLILPKFLCHGILDGQKKDKK